MSVTKARARVDLRVKTPSTCARIAFDKERARGADEKERQSSKKKR
jgi:hypothetical protein